MSLFKILRKCMAELGAYLDEISKPTVVGALCGLISLWLALEFNLLQDIFPISELGFYEYGTAMMGGALMGLAIKTLMIFAVEAAMRANAASAKLNSKRAIALAERLKVETKDKVKACVIQHAKEIIFQMHGEQEEAQLEEFFRKKMEVMSEGPNSKIDRHLDYLTDRAIHGDLESLKRLYQLYRRSPQEREKQISSMIDRIVNNRRQLQKLKDKIDSLYDQWKFRHDSRSYLSY